MLPKEMRGFSTASSQPSEAALSPAPSLCWHRDASGTGYPVSAIQLKHSPGTPLIWGYIVLLGHRAPGALSTSAALNSPSHLITGAFSTPRPRIHNVGCHPPPEWGAQGPPCSIEPKQLAWGHGTTTSHPQVPLPPRTTR